MAEKKKALSAIVAKLTHHHLKDELTPKELHTLKDKVKKAIAAHHEEEHSRKSPGEMDDHHFEKWSNEEIAKAEKENH